ncbi:MAG TPA: cellulose biosynthesis cyclic di-GMP-binding regulatory protein BcsB [Flexilinea sp.]|nr:cellulose biosynthesis cyclic di-GMP-binding regulatory protein BcsB [Flexilinea sp.]
MKKNLKSFIKKIIYIIFLDTLVLGPANIFVMGQSLPLSSENFKEFTLEDTGISTDDVLKGILVSRDYGISLPASWGITDAQVRIDFSHSQILNPKSSMAIDWNDVRLASIQLTKENADHGQLVVNIPAENVKKGYNTLHVELYMGISDNFCDDYDNPSVWATIHKSTAFHFDNELLTSQPDLGNLPLPFFDESPLAENHVTFVMTNQPGIGEMDALASVGAKLGELAGGWRKVSIDLISTVDAIKEQVQGNVILIGTLDGVNQIDPSINVSEEQGGGGILEEFVSPYDQTALFLVITGKTQEDVEKAGRAFANRTLYTRLGGTRVIVRENATASSGTRIHQLSTTFEELGYENRSAFGSRDQKLSFTIPLNSTVQSKMNAVLDLHFMHSVITSEEDPILSVLVNGLPVGSIKLNSDNANAGEATFQIPLNFFHAGNNDLSFEANMHILNNREDIALYCADRHIAEAWFTVNSDSNLTFPNGPDTATIKISDFPYIFMGLSDLSQLAFVMPDKTSITDLQSLSILALAFGKSSAGDPLMPHVIPASQISQNEEKYPYQVLIGLPLNHSAFLSQNDQIPLKFDPSTGAAEPLPVLDTIESGKISTGYVEAYVSQSNIPRLILTGNDEEGLLLAANLLNDNTAVINLNGDVAITTGKDRVISFWGKMFPISTSNDSVIMQDQLSLSMILFQKNAAFYTAILFLAFSILICIIRLFVVLRSKKINKEEHENNNK